MLPDWSELEGVGEFGAEGREEFAAGGEGGVGGASAADQDDAGGEGVGAFAPSMRLAFSVRIGQVPFIGKASTDDRFEKSLPAGAGFQMPRP